MLNITETEVGKIEIITRKTDNTEIVEQRALVGGKTAADITIMEAIKADIIATAEFHRGKQGGFKCRERGFTGQITVITVMIVV